MDESHWHSLGVAISQDGSCVQFSGSIDDDSFVKLITELTNEFSPRKVVIHGTHITARGLVALKSIPALEQLTLRCSGIGKSLKVIRCIPTLRELTLAKTDTEDSDLDCLSGSRNLECLNLSCTKVSGRGLKTLERLPRLRKLWLDTAHNTAKNGIMSCRCLRSLRFLSLADLDVHNRLDGLGEIPKLQSLYLANSSIDDTDLEEIAKASRLHTLWLSNCSITDFGLNTIQAMNELRYVDLDHVAVSANAVTQLSRARPDLEIFGLFQWGNASRDGIEIDATR